MNLFKQRLETFKKQYPDVEVTHENARFNGHTLYVAINAEKAVYVDYEIREVETYYHFRKKLLEEQNCPYVESDLGNYRVIIEKFIPDEVKVTFFFKKLGEKVPRKRKFRKVYANTYGKYVKLNHEKHYLPHFIVKPATSDA